MTRTGWIIGGVALAGVGVATAVVFSRKGGAKKGKAGRGVDTSPPGGATPKGAAGADGVYRLAGAGLRDVVCQARQAGSGAELARVLRSLREAVRISGAERVDLRTTGLVDSEMSAEQVDAELSEGIAKVEGISGLLWPMAAATVSDKLSGLPACDASAQTWAAVASGTGPQSALPASAAPEYFWGLGRFSGEAAVG
jgi:hypothetical protein